MDMTVRTTVMGIFAVTISLILIMGWFFPTIGDLETEHEKTATYRNEGPYFARTDDSGETHTIVCTLDGTKGNVTTDGETARIIEPSDYPLTIAIGSSVIVVLYENGDVDAIATDGTTNIGNIGSTVSMTLTGTELSYGGGDIQGIELYAVHTGNYSEIATPTVSKETEMWICGIQSTAEGTVGYVGKGTGETIGVTPLDPTQDYADSSLHLTKDELDTGAQTVTAEITTQWGDDTTVQQYSLIVPTEVTVGYSVAGLTDMEMKIILSIGIMIVAGMLMFCIRFL